MTNILKNNIKRKRIIFLTGTRADFGKIKSLIMILSKNKNFDVHIFVTGMHLLSKYGSTYKEIEKSGFKNIYLFKNFVNKEPMDIILSNTIKGFSKYVKRIKPDLIIVHGDRPEALAGAIVGSFNNIITGHIEGGELSGTVDDSIRHSISKLSHIHFVANKDAKNRLIQMGENSNSIFKIGSPDVDVMISKKLPSLNEAKKHYNIYFNYYAILLFHPVTTEFDLLIKQSKILVKSLLTSKKNYIVIQPNNDHGSEFIQESYKYFKNNRHFLLFPSIRFEYFLTLLKNAQFIIGNSSAGIREAPYFGIPTIDIGSRQNNRSKNNNVIHCNFFESQIKKSIKKAILIKNVSPQKYFGNGKSDKIFFNILNSKKIWQLKKQKKFKELKWDD